jgi:hypothetical protein
VRPRAAAAVGKWSRYLGALALLGVGLDHLEQFSVDSYSAIPTIGTLFALNFAAATLLACVLAAPVQRLPGRAGRLAVPLLGVAGIGVAAGSLAGLLVSESAGLFGFTEVGYRPAILLSIALEVTTIVLLAVHLVSGNHATVLLTRGRDRPRTTTSSTGDSARART